MFVQSFKVPQQWQLATAAAKPVVPKTEGRDPPGGADQPEHNGKLK